MCDKQAIAQMRMHKIYLLLMAASILLAFLQAPQEQVEHLL